MTVDKKKKTLKLTKTATMPDNRDETVMALTFNMSSKEVD